MPVIDLFSKRLARERAEAPDVYQYDVVPKVLRVQVVRIWERTIGTKGLGLLTCYDEMLDALLDEYGRFHLLPGRFPSAEAQLSDFFVNHADDREALDILELSCQLSCRRMEALERRVTTHPETNEPRELRFAAEMIAEVNGRLRESGLGYQFQEGQLIRIDSEFVHAEAVKPALKLLHDGAFRGAEAEFLNAHEHYRHGRHEEALTECGKAFESVMKTICDRRGWSYDPKKARSKQLIKTCLDNELVPRMWQEKLSSLRALLESSVPAARSTLGAHGAGSEARVVPGYIVSYVLHMTASVIVFLVEAERHLPRLDGELLQP